MLIHPLFKMILRNKASAIVIVGELALCFAILCNAGHLIGRRLERMNQPTGLADDELTRVYLANLDQEESDPKQIERDLQAIRSISGVQEAEANIVLPFGGSSFNTDVTTDSEREIEGVNASIYMGGSKLAEVWGLNIVRGRDLREEEFVAEKSLYQSEGDFSIPSVLLTQALCDALFADGPCLGKDVYAWGKNPHRVVGIVDHLLRPNDMFGEKAREYVMVLPITWDKSHYAIRSTPGDRKGVLKQVEATLLRENPDRLVVHSESFAEMIDRWYHRDRSMIWLLAVTCALLLLVSGFGIVGMVSFWVQQRKKQIGVRRALGASRLDIVRQFQIENLILMLLGVLLGTVLAVALNQVLMQYYEVPRIPLHLFPLAALVVVCVGQLAVWWPAYGASKVPPATATRSV